MILDATLLDSTIDQLYNEITDRYAELVAEGVILGCPECCAVHEAQIDGGEALRRAAVAAWFSDRHWWQRYQIAQDSHYRPNEVA